MTVNVIDYGATPDGVTDCYAAFQKAENELKAKMEVGEIYVPTGKYLVSQPFYHWSNLTLRGDGADSVILNTTPVNTGTDDNFCIHIGNFKPSTFAKCVHYRVKDIVKGQNFVKLFRATDISLFEVGDCVLIDSVSGFRGHENDFKPYAAFINRITHIDTLQRALYFEDPIITAIVGARVAKAATDNPKEYICQFPVVRNISFQSNGDWTMRWGCYKGIFQDLWIKSTDVIGANGLSHCSFENIVAQFSQKVIELATYSHETYINNLTAKWYDGPKERKMRPLIAMGENVRGCIYKNMNIDAGTMQFIGMAIRFEHAFANTISDSVFTIPEIPGGVVEFSSTDDKSIVTDNKVFNNRFYTTNARAFVKADIGASTAVITSNSAINNEFHGTVFKNELGNALSTNEISGNTYITT